MTKNIRNLALATMSGFRHKTVDVPEWEGATVVLREPFCRSLVALAGDR